MTAPEAAVPEATVPEEATTADGGAVGVPPEEADVADLREGLGDPRVDAAVARLDAAVDRPGAEQVAEYEAVHRVLQDTLATIDEA